MKNPNPTDSKLTWSEEIKVNFFDADPLGIVWHGNYLKYFEIAREAFGRHFGLTYLDVKKQGYATPIVKTITEHKSPLKYGDTARVNVFYHDCDAAKLKFTYRIYNQNELLVCIGETVQVFTNYKTAELSLTFPDFFVDWKKLNGL